MVNHEGCLKKDQVLPDSSVPTGAELRDWADVGFDLGRAGRDTEEISGTHLIDAEIRRCRQK